MTVVLGPKSGSYFDRIPKCSGRVYSPTIRRWRAPAASSRNSITARRMNHALDVVCRRFRGSDVIGASATARRAARRPAHFDPAAVEFFEKKIRPLLADNCYNCHSANTNAKGGLRVDDRNGMLLGGGRGAAIVPGNPDKSLLLHAVRQTDADVKMPPKKHLSDEQIADLTAWIRNGAAWPGVEVPDSIGKANPKYDKLRKEHWAWQPIHQAHVPAVQDEAWVHDDIDRFILVTLEKGGLTPVADADKARPDPQGDLRSDRPSSYARGNRRIYQRHLDDCICDRRRPVARFRIIRPALGPALA